LGRGQTLGVLHQPFDPENLGADWFLRLRRSRDEGVYRFHFEFRFGSSERAT
jgi:hypothetical protein